jgi:predicted RNA-binding Zn ribbon-like protein
MSSVEMGECLIAMSLGFGLQSCRTPYRHLLNINTGVLFRSTGKALILVLMRLTKKYAISKELAVLYEFLNSTDLRTYVEKGVQHVRSDELETPAQLEIWMRERGLLQKDQQVSTDDHRHALELRSAVRTFLQLPPASRAKARQRVQGLNRASNSYPLVVRVAQQGTLKLQPAGGANGLGQVLAELFALAENGRLDRLKMCSSDECHWVFFDRSKPGKRRWCSSLLCGNRQKTRDYRKRAKSEVHGTQTG